MQRIDDRESGFPREVKNCLCRKIIAIHSVCE